MVHEKFYTLRMCILVERFDVEIRVRSNEIEHVILVAVSPVFPAYVPAFYENLVEAVFRGEVDIAAYILVVCRMLAVRFRRSIVSNVKSY